MTNSVGDLTNAAASALQKGARREAERLCRDALAIDPKDYKSLVLLSHLLREMHDYDQSAGLAEAAIQLRPNMVEAYFQLAMCLLASGRFEQAAMILKRAISLRPEFAIFHLNLGIASENLGWRSLARQSFERASCLNPNDPEAMLCYISHLVAEQDLVTARVKADAAILKFPDSASANLVMAELCIAEKGLLKAEPFIRRVLEIEPHNSAANALLGFRESETGNFVRAEELFKRSIELKPVQGQAYLGLAQISKIGSSDLPMIGQMEQIARRRALAPEEAGSICFALAKAYDNLENWESAMQFYDEGHRLTYLARFGQEPFNKKKYRKIFDTIIDYYSEPVADAGPDLSGEGKMPILIVGMIRSGTTLTEQILSSHPEVGAAGEERFWQMNAGNPDDLPALNSDPERLTWLANQYVEALRTTSPNKSRVTDKFPGNYLRLGLIRTAFPNAKIIHCRRRPIENGLSIYLTPLKSSPVFSHAKGSIVFAYQQYLRLMDHWRTILPSSNFFEVDYEDLVENPELVTRSMLEFCGLEWSDRCLRPELNNRDVLTASQWQVRQPIYKTSVERWRRYEPWLGELKQLVFTG